MSKAVSIYIPSHNRPLMLERALESVKKQTHKNIQVLVCDDGSKISYDEVVSKYKNAFQDFIYVRNETPKGACVSRNRLIAMASGDYVTGLDDDDEFLPDRVSGFLNAPELSQYPYLCDTHRTKTKKDILLQRDFQGAVDIKKLLNRNIVGNQVFAEKTVYDGISGFDAELPAWQDYDAWVRMSVKYGGGYKLNNHSYQWNIDHEEGRISNSPKAKLGYEMFIRKHADLLTRENLAHLFLQDKINRKDAIAIQELMQHYSSSIVPLYIKYTVGKRVPFIKSFLHKMK